MSTAVGHRARQTMQVLFVLSMLAFLALGAVLVVLQVVGLVLLDPALVAGASDALLVPAIAAAVVFGLVSFAAGYLAPGEPDDS